jgi:hypothetical protein
MPYIAKISHEAVTFLGNFSTLEAIGGILRRTQTRATSGAAFSAALDEWVGPDGRVIEAGAVYVREVYETAPGVLGTPGSWVYFGQTWDATIKDLNAVVLNRQAKAAAGAPMINPLGLPIIDPSTGTRPTQPASGQPSRDPWTGELDGGTQA